jgi:hypothetical protein
MSILYKNKNTNVIQTIFSTANIGPNNILNLDQGLKINSINPNILYELNVTGNINFTGGLFQNDVPFSSPISANIANIYKYLFSEPLFIGANVIPRINNVYNLGNVTNTWGSLYIGNGNGNGFIHMGNNIISSNSGSKSGNININVNDTVNITGNLFSQRQLRYSAGTTSTGRGKRLDGCGRL